MPPACLGTEYKASTTHISISVRTDSRSSGSRVAVAVAVARAVGIVVAVTVAVQCRNARSSSHQLAGQSPCRVCDALQPAAAAGICVCGLGDEGQDGLGHDRGVGIVSEDGGGESQAEYGEVPAAPEGGGGCEDGRGDADSEAGEEGEGGWWGGCGGGGGRKIGRASCRERVYVLV